MGGEIIMKLKAGGLKKLKKLLAGRTTLPKCGNRNLLDEAL